VSAGFIPEARAGALEQAPEVTLENVHGKRISISYSGNRLTLVNFWAVWCVPCHEEMPQIADMVSKFKEQGFRAYGITMESGDAARVRAFLGDNPEFGINYEILMGEVETAVAFGEVMVVPTTFLVDHEGKVVKSYVGISTDFGEKVTADITALLGGSEGDTSASPDSSPDSSQEEKGSGTGGR
jgi:thiol-disulfide isomerase/thioredoxin